MLRFGPQTGPVAVVALPLFEEANRVRAFAVTLCRLLAERGLASVLPDMPGQGESVVPLETMCSPIDFSEAYARLADSLANDATRIYGVAIRGGALLDCRADLAGRWHFAPQTGLELLRELTRIKQAATETTKTFHEFSYQEPPAPDGKAKPPVEVAGNLISANFFAILNVGMPAQQAEDAPVRTVRLDTDTRPADRHVPGTPLWRRAEPGHDPVLAALLANDIAGWIDACEG